METVLITFFFIFSASKISAQGLLNIETSNSQINAPSVNIKIDSFKITILGRNLVQPFIITPQNLDEWNKIFVDIIPPDNLPPGDNYNIDITIDSGETWIPLKESLNYEFEPADEIKYIIGFRLVTDNNAETKIFKDYPITYIRHPETYYSNLVKDIVTRSFNSKDSGLFLNQTTKSYFDPWGSREDMEDRLLDEFEKYSYIKFSVKNFKVFQLNLAEFKVEFEWTKVSEAKEGNKVINIFGKSYFIFLNNLLNEAGGDPIFNELLNEKQSSKVSGNLKGGTINLTPGVSFEFSTDNFYENSETGDINVKKLDNNIVFSISGGGIQDMGISEISEIEEAPEEGYTGQTPVIIGHTYCLRDNEKRYAKIHVSYVEGGELNQTSYVVTINWIYQERDTRILKPQ